jgi:1-acyl-sn-glycerol-3-phosphate acyltransferase
MFVDLEVRGAHHLAAVERPAIYYYNYQGPYAPLLLLPALPAARRARLALAVDARLWRGRERWQGLLAALFGGGFPLDRAAPNPRATLRTAAGLLDAGWSIAYSPEGRPEPGGRLLPFQGGAGFLAVRLGAPVVPVRVDGYHLIFPNQNSAPDALRFPYLPVRRGRVRLTFGAPLEFPAGTPHRAATERMHAALVGLGGESPLPLGEGMGRRPPSRRHRRRASAPAARG